MILDSVRDHYLGVLGPPSREAQFGSLGFSVEVLKWNAESNPEGVAIYASIGASAHPMKGHNPSHRFEFFLGLLPEMDRSAISLGAVSLDSRVNDSTLDYWHLYTYEEHLWPGTEMNSFLLAKPVEEIIPGLVFPDGIHIEFVQLIPLFPSEADYVRSTNGPALLDAWRSLGVPFWDPHRIPWP